MRIEHGCGRFTNTNGNSEDALRLCVDTPVLPAAWSERINQIAVDCSTTTADRIIVKAWTVEQYDGIPWGYTFAC